MLNISLQFLWNRRKQLALLLTVLIFSLALLLVIHPLFDRTEQKIRDLYTSRYGSHHGAILHLDERKIQLLEEEDGIDIAYFRTYGSWEQQQTGWQLTLGWFSEQAIEMGRLRLLEGRFPESEGEITLEQNAVKFSCPEGTKVGDTLTFSKDGKLHQFTLVGIMADYVGNWDPVWSTTIISGYNDFPKGFIFQSEMEAQTGALLTFRNTTPIDAIDRVLTLSVDLMEDPETELWWKDVVRNEKLCAYPEDGGIFQSFRSFKGLMTIAVLVGVCMIVMVVMGMYAGEFKGSYHTMYLLGAGNGATGRVYGLQCALILLIALPAALLLAQIFAWCHGDLRIFYWKNFVWPSVAVLAISGFMRLVFRVQIAPLLKRSLSRMKRGKGAKQIKHAGGVTTMLATGFMRSNFRKVLAILCIIAILVASFGIVDIYAKEFDDDGRVRRADFIVSAHLGCFNYANSIPVHDYKDDIFDLALGLELYDMPGVDMIDAETSVNASILIPGASAYWGRFHEKDEPVDIKNADKIEGIPTTGVTVLNDENWNFYVKVIPESIEAEYLAAYPDLPLEQMKEEGSVALILPPVDTLHYDILEVGDELVFGGISMPDDVEFDIVREHPELLSYHECSLPIAYISEEERDTGREKNYYAKPTVFLTQRTALEGPLVKGYLVFLIYIDPNISEADYAAIEQKLGEIGAGISGATIYSLREEREQNAQLTEVVKLSLTMTLIVFGIFAVIAIYSALYMTILQRKRSIAIYRALGLKRRTMTMAMMLELLFYWLAAIMGAFVIGLLIFHFLWRIGNFLYMGRGLPLIRALLIALAAGLPLNGAIVWSLQRNIYKESVYSAMRFGE